MTESRALGKLAADLAKGAADLVSSYTHAEQDVTAKSTETDLVTQTDRAAESWLVEQILAARPRDAILGEEGGERPGTSGVRWVIDPIDGTVNYVLGIPQYAVSVAAEVDGTVVAGAVCNPATGALYTAVVGQGAYCGDRRLTGPRDVPLARAVLGTGFGYEAGRRARQVRLLAGLLPDIADVRRMGAAALDLCAVASGQLDGYFEIGLNPWDFAAGVLIATEAGCAASGLGGDAPSTALTVVAGRGLLPELMRRLTELGVQDVL
jgi:fructose-1,6-bisphosphatase/inositol monophosphatase family enzyme